jgi:hypothetical protein
MKRREPITSEDREYNARHDPTNQKDWVDACLNSNKLNTWELDFIASIEVRVESGKDLTDKQAETLEKIYNEKT